MVHDEVERQIYFDNAQFRLAGVPVFAIPRLRMPDPTLTRATGFLMPSIRTTSDLGTGILIPYFFVLGSSSDLTVTPYLTFRDSTTLNLRYRQAFATGRIEVNGAVTRDKLIPGDPRGYLFVDGAFTLPWNFGLTIKGQTVSDPAYLLDYGIANLTGSTAGSRPAAPGGTNISRPGSSASRPCATTRTTPPSLDRFGPDLPSPLLAGADCRRRRLAAPDPQPLSQLDQPV